VLFEGSVYENILLARPEATEADVLLAAQQAQAEEFIVSLPQSYSTHVGENGVRLSGGQRQRIALARAFLKNAPILILDEATSALDAESEIKVQEALKTLTQNRTVLIIAHRFATIRLASNILLFEKGHIRNQGDFDTIMRDPLFKRLHEMQVM
jgi:subfamily B ATP-binding cassette protein MsbA